MRITLHNDCHRSKVSITVPALPHTLTLSQVKRLRKSLCGHSDCACGVIRGPQHDADGNRLEVAATGDSKGRATWTLSAL